MNKDVLDLYERARRVPIEDVLARYNIIANPNSRANIRSPFREDHDPSFHVYYDSNRWHDFGLNEGGSTVDLVMKLANVDKMEAVKIILDGDVAAASECRRPYPIERAHSEKNEKHISILEEKEISSPKLKSYSEGRCIPVGLLKRWCKEVKFSTKGKDKNTGELKDFGPYYAIGFRNDAGGYVLRTAPMPPGAPKGFKRCNISAITTVRVMADTICSDAMVFEGFFNFLSWMVLHGDLKTDVYVLNSVSNVNALDGISSKGVRKLYCYLDIDERGEEAYCHIREKSGCKVFDCSDIYREAGVNDLNDYLVLKRK